MRHESYVPSAHGRLSQRSACHVQRRNKRDAITACLIFAVPPQKQPTAMLAFAGLSQDVVDDYADDLMMERPITFKRTIEFAHYKLCLALAEQRLTKQLAFSNVSFAAFRCNRKRILFVSIRPTSPACAKRNKAWRPMRSTSSSSNTSHQL